MKAASPPSFPSRVHYRKLIMYARNTSALLLNPKKNQLISLYADDRFLLCIRFSMKKKKKTARELEYGSNRALNETNAEYLLLLKYSQHDIS